MTSTLTGHGERTPAGAGSEHGLTDSEMLRIDPALMRSWQRCSELGVARDQEGPRPPRAAVDQRGATLAAHALSLVRPAMEDVYQFIEGSRTVIGFVDADARLLEMIGDAALRDDLATVGWSVGACVSEASAGTNGPALAVEDSFPALVNGAAHYCTFLTPYCTAGAPVHDSLGALVGALFAIVPAGECHPHTLGMISAAAATLSGELRMNLWLSSANELFSELNAILQTLPEGILLLQPDGTVSHMNARAGHLLGCTTARAVGQRLADLAEMPAALHDALRQGRELHDEEVTFVVRGSRVSCVCTLRGMVAPTALTAPAPLVGLAEVAARMGLAPVGALRVSPTAQTGGYVLTLRSIERVQRLVHRMSGAQARIRFGNIVGQSPALSEATRLAHIAAESASTVLLHGETGTGKELFAQSIHNASARASGPFVAINCAAIPRELISSELFGYEGGAFTGADRMGRPGKFELANGGTLFLDEIGDMPPDLQSSLLRALETRSIVRVGGQHVIPVDVRVVAATHRDLAEEVRRSTFRSDLFFRLNVFPVEVPALRDRPGDVALLLHYTLQRLSTRLNRPLGVDAEALEALNTYTWPGNIRELENVIERVVYIADHAMITLGDLPDEIRLARRGHEHDAGMRAQHGTIGAMPDETVEASTLSAPRYDLRHESASAEWQLIERALRVSGGNMADAARQLGISRTTLWRKMRRATAR